MTKALLIHPYLRSEIFTFMRQPSDKMRELISLSEAVDLSVVETSILKISEIRPATYIGTGAVQALGETIQNHNIDLVVVNAPITPIQQRNLEQAWGRKVIDRTGLILEIFGARAQTNEGRLQVSLASLTYQRSRLVRTWTHLERQRGGHGFLGGPGELQIELDRRMLDQRIAQIQKQLDGVKRTRGIQRQGRQKKKFIQLALVGYTNAGKSTLFNALTGADAMAKNLLFATLDPTIRALDPRFHLDWVISDTVGFISDLPTELVAAFRATLEEVRAADLLVHVHDASSPEHREQASDVAHVLETLFEDQPLPPTLQVYNKIDALDDAALRYLKAPHKGDTSVLYLSALKGINLEQFIHQAESVLTQHHKVFEVTLKAEQSDAVAWLHDHGKILEKKYEDDHIFLRVRLDVRDENRFKKMWL